MFGTQQLFCANGIPKKGRFKVTTAIRLREVELELGYTNDAKQRPITSGSTPENSPLAG